MNTNGKIVKSTHVSLPREAIFAWLVEQQIIEKCYDQTYRLKSNDAGRIDLSHVNKWATFFIEKEPTASPTSTNS